MFHWPVKPLKVSESECPVPSIDTLGADGRKLRVWWREPSTEGLHPAIVFSDCGLRQFLDESLRQHLTDNPVIAHFLSKGYAVVKATFRTYEQDVQSRGPIEDVRKILIQTAKHPTVDAQRIAL